MRRTIAWALLCALLLAALCPAALAAQYVSASTPLGTDGARISNIRLAAEAINGVYVAYGSSFSFNDAVGARTTARGYQSAVNGRGVQVVGGGVAQVASTLYLALKQVEGISYDQKRTYASRYNQSYVSSQEDAILVDGAAGVDFAFTNGCANMTIEAHISGDMLVCSLNFDSAYSASDTGATLAQARLSLSGDAALLNNISLAAQAIDQTVLSSGDTFSFNALVGARTAERGYQSAVNGRGAQVVGGGVAQVASAVWLAIKQMDQIAIVEKSTYASRYNQHYVDSAADAILTDYNAGTDFSFRYTGTGSIVIRTYVSGGELICEISREGAQQEWSDGWVDQWSEVPTFGESGW